MRRILALLGLAVAAYAILPAAAQAQVVIVGRPAYYAPPVVVSQSYYPPITYSAPPVVTYSSPPVVTYSSPPVVSYYSGPPVVAYSAPPVVTYSAPPTVVTYAAPAPGVYTTRSYYGFGIFRPRGWNTETYYRP